jgi:hypothetical protein
MALEHYKIVYGFGTLETLPEMCSSGLWKRFGQFYNLFETLPEIAGCFSKNFFLF